jgi:hypothetical protein
MTLTLDQPIGLNRDARFIYRNKREIMRTSSRTSLTVPNLTLTNIFIVLRNEWLRETINYSAPVDIFGHPAYKAIVAGGEIFIPYILNDIQNYPYHWIHALFEITNENPVKPESVGDIQATLEDWRDWGRKKLMLFIA